MECVKPLFETLKPAKIIVCSTDYESNVHHAKVVAKQGKATILNKYFTFSVQDSLGPLALDLRNPEILLC